MRAIAVRKRRGRIGHAVSEGADCWQETLCDKPAQGMVIAAKIDCPGCRAEIERLGWTEVPGE